MDFKAELRKANKADRAHRAENDEDMVDVTDGQGHWMTFTTDELQRPDTAMNAAIAPGVLSTISDLREFKRQGWECARDFAIKEGMIPLSGGQDAGSRV